MAGGGIVSDCFNNTPVNTEGVANKLLTVTGDSTSVYLYTFPAERIYFLKLAAHYFHRISAVGVVICIQKLCVLAYKRKLCGGASAVNAKPSAPAVTVYILTGHICFCMTGAELAVFGLG